MHPPHLPLLQGLALLALACPAHAQVYPYPPGGEPVTVEFTPSAKIIDFIGDNARFSWNVTASYTSSLSDAAGWGGRPEDTPLHIPILYFPSPGTTRVGVGGHPCVVRPPNGCCLLDFVEQYTSVAFYEYIQSLSHWLNRTTCAGIEDLRPIVRGIYDSGLAPDMITGALRGFHGASVEVSPMEPTVGVGPFARAHAVVPHPVMRSVMASNFDDLDAVQVEGAGSGSNRTAVVGTAGTLITFVGIMWLRTHVGEGGLLHRGLDVLALQKSVKLTITDRFLAFGSGSSHPSGGGSCVMTPQGACLYCQNGGVPPEV
jgi:hypothetical protein